MNINQISLIEPKSKNKNFFSHFKGPRLGLTLLATVLRDIGYTVRVFYESNASIDWDYVYKSDICGISSFTDTADIAYTLSHKIMNRNIPVIIGGPHASLCPEETLQHCNVVVRGEGEISFPELLSAMQNKSDLKKIKGISYKEGGTCIHNPAADLVNMDALPSPDLSLVSPKNKFNIIDSYINIAFLSTTRGCPYACEFCTVNILFGKKYRMRSTPNIISDIEKIIKQKNPNVIFFIDDNFVVDRKRTVRLLNEIIKREFNKRFCVMIRASTALDEELLELMKMAGIYLVQIGFESVDQYTLDEYNKNLTIEEIVQAVRNLRKHGILIHGMFVFGSDSDKPGIVDKTVDFCLEHGIDTIQLFPLTPYSGTKLTRKLSLENRLIPMPHSWYDGQRASILSKNIRPSTMIWELYKGYNKFYSFRRALRLLIQEGLESYAFVCNAYALIWLKLMLWDCLKRMKYVRKNEKGRYNGNTLIR
jgi:radical SAM superfamily enzyme YgiQ (UPF0313 family)